MKRRKPKTVWCYLDGEKHCDVVQWALAANVMLSDAKRMLAEQYPDREATFRTE